VSISNNHPKQVTAESQLAFCITYPALVVPYTRTIHRKGEKYELTG
jgi:hypothetical protein